MKTEDPYIYLDEDGKQNRIQNLTNEFYYKRIHTARVEGSTEEDVYWINLYVGSPPQKQTAIIDTGSSFFSFPCSECMENCGNHLNKRYNFTESNTSQKMACNQNFGNFHCQSCGSDKFCEWDIRYQEGSSLKGYMVIDYVVFGDEMQDYLNSKSLNELTEEQDIQYLKFMNHEKVQLPFGCVTVETNQFKNQKPDGILGLGPNSNSFSNPPNILDSIFQQHKENDEQLVFSLCLNSRKGGYMSIGGYNHELHIPGAQTKIINFSPNSDFYEVKVNQIRVNILDKQQFVLFIISQQIKLYLIILSFIIKFYIHGDKVIATYIPNPIIDSGSTFIYGPTSFIDQLKNEVYELCKSRQYKCGNASKDQYYAQKNFLYTKSKEFPTVDDFLNSFPSFQFDFGDKDHNVTIELKPHGYLYVDPQNYNSKLFSFTLEPISQNKVYLGGPFFKNYDVLFDKNKHEIHFTPSNCKLPYINSALMNTHTQKIRQTINDSEFISDLKEFQKSFNYTPKFYNLTYSDDIDTNADTNPIDDNDKDNDTNNDNNNTNKDNDKDSNNDKDNDDQKDKDQDSSNNDNKNDKDKDDQKNKDEENSNNDDKDKGTDKNDKDQNTSEIESDSTNNDQSNKFFIFFVLLLVVAVILCFCKRDSSQEKDLIPLQTVEHGQHFDDSQVQHQDQDDQLKSEEDIRFGYKNDPTYKANELNRHEDNQYSNLNQYQDDEENERRDAIHD